MLRETFKPIPFKATIFDLDGVLTQTGQQHFLGWKNTFEVDAEAGPFTETDYALYVSGRPRTEGIKSFLFSRGIFLNDKKLQELATTKNNRYLALLDKMPPQVFQPAVDLARVLSEHGIKMAVASSSENTPLILERTGLRELFPVVVANQNVLVGQSKKVVPLRGKPEPDIFLQACKEMQVEPTETIGFEDAPVGILAFKAAGIISIGVDREGIEDKLLDAGATIVVKELSELSVERLGEIFKRERAQSFEHQ